MMASSLPLLTEQVSRPEIKVLNSTQENGNCSLMLACMVEKGDHVTYSWSQEGGVILPSPANCSHLLYLTLGPQHADNVYICTANNPISNRSQTFIPWSRCSPSSSGECPGGGSHVTLNDMRSVPTWTNCSASIAMAVTLMFFSIVCKSFPCAFSGVPTAHNDQGDMMFSSQLRKPLRNDGARAQDSSGDPFSPLLPWCQPQGCPGEGVQEQVLTPRSTPH